MLSRLVDRGLAVAGWLTYSVRRIGGGRPRVAGSVASVLLVMSAVPLFLVASTPRPTDLSFDDMRLERIPAMTSWGRLEGELHRTSSASGGLYELHDTADPALYVIVNTEADLPDGHAMVTGRVSPRRALTGNVGTIDADVPAVPRVDEPIWLYLTPAVLAILIMVGMRVGYPVLRGDRRSAFFVAQVADGEPIRVQWSGRIGREVVERADERPGTVAVAPAPDATQMDDLTLVDDVGSTSRTTRLRQHAAVREVRLCRVTRTDPGLELHPAAADIVLTFVDRAERDRLVARLL